MDNTLEIRLATFDDTKSIVDIYNQGIRKRYNAILDQISLEEYSSDFWFRDLDDYPIYVAEIDNIIVGWISISPYRANRRAYSNSKEVSFYLDENFIGKGIGSSLLHFIIENQANIGFRNLFAILVANNQSSISLLKKFDFSLWGLMPKVLEMDDRLEDAAIYGRNFK